MQNNEAINKGIERFRVANAQTHTHMNKKKSRTTDHNNILNNTMDCHPQMLSEKKEYQKITHTSHTEK